MADANEIIDRDEQMLARIAELDLSAAERVHAKLMAAEDAAEVAELGRTYQRLARSLRQTHFLKARLKRERAQQAREAEEAAELARERRITAHRARISRTVERFIETEAEGEEIDDLNADLEAWLDEAVLADRFLEETAETHITRACESLGLSGPSSSPEGHTSEEGDHEVVEGALPPHRDSG